MIKIKDEYKISEAADFLGISPDTIRYYDNQKILCPRKDEATNYRYYTWADLISLEHILRLRRINLSLQEIGHMVNEYSMDETLDIMLQHERVLEKQLDELTAARKMLRTYITIFEEISRKEGELKFEMSPVLICRKIDREVNRIFEDFQKLASWQLPLFTIVASVNVGSDENEIPYRKYIDEIRNKEEACISIVDDGTLAESRLVKENSEIKVLPSRFCLHGIKKVPHKQEPAVTMELIKYAWQHGYEVDGPLVIRLLTYLKERQIETDYYHIYVPVRPKENKV